MPFSTLCFAPRVQAFKHGKESIRYSPEPTATEGRGDKSKAIRELIDSGLTKPAEIMAKAKEQGIELNAGLISSVKSKYLARSGAAKPKAGNNGRGPDMFQLLVLKNSLAAAGGEEIVLQAF
ncbi:MAG TPA: hypothetical protein VGP68_01065 [Gemmataceae bacterium]|jgi:hypothetical protein|nr:hypothetical protein [Gemmataceae bacterium]